MNTDEHVGHGDKLEIGLLRVGEVNLKKQKNISQRGFSSVSRMETYWQRFLNCFVGKSCWLVGWYYDCHVRNLINKT